MMFRAILETQWKWTRVAILVATLMAFLIPIGSLAIARRSDTAREFVIVMQTLGFAYALLAAALGVAIAMLAWGHDHRGRHVYALALPVPRWRYALLRLGAGGVFLVPPVLAVLIGAGVVAASGLVPEGLHTYGLPLTIRFALAAGVALAVFFAIAAATQRTAGIILGAIAAIALVQYVLELGGTGVDIVGPIVDSLMGRGGLLSVFAGRWMLIDA